MKLKEIKGVYTALVTPIIKGEVNESVFKRLINYQLENGSDGLLVLGGTGEYVALSREQRIKAVKICIKETKKRVPVICGILDPGLNDAIEMGKNVKDLGVDAIMLLNPYYVVPTQKGIINYYLEFIENVDMPIVLYNIPYKTNVNILPETVLNLINQTPNIIGIKECTTNLDQASRLILLIGDKISFCCGEEPLLFTELIMGAKGAFMATSNLFPQIFKKMYLLIKEGNIEGAKEIHFKIIPLLRSLFAETNPGPLKEAMKCIGIDCGSVLPPLVMPDRKLVEIINKNVNEIKNFLKQI